MDICEGRLTCPLNSAVVLASYAVQSHFGDYNSSIHHPGYLSESQFIPDQNDDFVTKVESLHEQHSGLKQSEAESCFINIARTLDFYGVELHSGRDLHNLNLMIGIASAGIAVYRKYICTSFYPWVNILKISFKRKKFFIHQRQKQTESRDHIVAFNMLNYRSCKTLWKSCVEHHTFFQAKKLLPREKNVLSQYWTLGSRNPNKRSPRLRHEIRKPRHSSADNLANEMTYITETEDVFYTYKGSLSPKDSDSEVSQNQSPHQESIPESNPAQSCTTRKSSSSVSPSSNAPGSCSPDGVDQQFLEDFHRVTKGGSTEDSSQYYCDKNDNGDGYLILIRITPDEEGKFGFNLKGGVDQKMPLVVSRINPESPADTCIPKLNEGDQIVLINGRDISEHTHDQVVMFIKASRESHTRELALVIRRKAVHSFADIKSEDELNQLFPEAIFPECPEGADTLEGSMEQLKKGLESGTVLIQFEKNETLDHLISLSGAVQLRHLSNNLETLLKRDFLKLLPLELSFYLLKWLDPQTLLTCCLVSKQWNKVISACTEVWQIACKNLGWQIDDSVQDALHWKKVYLKAILRMKQLEDHEAFETSSLIGHSARVYALYYKDGLLCTGSDDLSAKLWDVSTGQCIYGIQTHTCAAVKFDEQKLVTGSFDNTVACWEWSSGARTQHFRGHTGAVFSVDYNDELDILVSGSADFTVKVWALSAGTCLNTLTGHTEWVTKVVLQKCKVKSLLHSPGDYILLSADKYEIKIWPIGREINCKCLKTLSVSEDRSICLQPRLHFDGKYIVCSSALGLYQWDFASYDILRVIKTPEIANLALLGFGDVFALLFDNRYLYIMDLRTESLISRWPLPEYRKSKRGSSFLAGEASWLNGLDGHNDTGLVFATSMPDHSIHLVLWKEHG